MDILKVNLKHAGYINKKNTIYDLQFTIKQGEMVGLIGPNGAGKSTTIKAIVGLLPEVIGEVSFVGENKKYAYIPEQPILYDKLTLWEHLELVAAAYELNTSQFYKRVEELLVHFRLAQYKHHLPVTFSKGMQQKLMIIIGLLIQPAVYIIDEPFVGLDPRATMQFIQLLEEEKCTGASMLLSTHQLDIAEKICDSLILINEGKIIIQRNLEQIRAKCAMPQESLFNCFNYLLEQEI